MLAFSLLSPISQSDPLFIAILFIKNNYLIDGQILEWCVFDLIIVVPSRILFWEFMSLSVP